MIQLVQPVETTKNAVEVVVYVRESLDTQRQQDVVAELVRRDGIMQAEFCPLRNHLVIARYDKGQISSQDVIQGFHSLKLEARLVGPI